ncbi:NYN domain-containing protein [Streptacidiphilus sp. N1-3]|uniref:NYN domain-containing protein n=1 Tax=Streptacidiphilus alkalitolerans TaxID=3342712 RepID=A0ABV6XC65_9ACTN
MVERDDRPDDAEPPFADPANADDTDPAAPTEPDPAASDSAEPAPDADDAPGTAAERLERPLPEGVRRRVVGIAADGLAAVPAAELPHRLRPYAKFTPVQRARRGATAIAAALETEPGFRSRIAERVRLGQPDLVAALEAGQVPAAADPQDVAAVAYLLRPPGWSKLVGDAGEEVERAESEGAAAEATRLVEKLQVELAALRETSRTDADRGRAELDEAKKERDSLRRRLRSLEADTKRAEAATRKVTAELEALRSAGVTERGAVDSEVRRLKHRLTEAEAALEASRRASREGRSAEDMRLRLLLDVVLQGAQGLQRELGLPPLSEGRPADTVEAVLPVSASPHDVARRALDADDPALLDQLLALPHTHLLVDGYNVTKSGYPTLPLEKQRARLLNGLSMLAMHSRAEVTCVFDGKDLDAPVPMAPPRGVRVLFSRSGETADELIRRLVRAEPEGRPVVVVSTDREVADGVRKAGARPVPSAMLLRRLIRT